MSSNKIGVKMFRCDENIQKTCFVVGDGPLSTILLKNEREYPWFILVPRKENIQELHELSRENRHILMDEIYSVSLLVRDYFHPTKLNTGALGNIVKQLHIHIIGRFNTDNLWPQGVWQSAMVSNPYSELELMSLVPELKEQIAKYFTPS